MAAKQGKKGGGGGFGGKTACGAVFVLALALWGGVHYQMHSEMVSRGGAQAIRSLACVRDIRMGDGSPAPWHGQYDRPDMWWYFSGMWKAVVGLTWLHPFSKWLDFGMLSLPQDPESQFCYSLLSYMWSHPLVSGFAYPSVYAGSEESTEWLKQCRIAWNEMGDEERALLGPYRSQGAVPLEILISAMENNDQQKEVARSKGLPPYEEDSHRLSREEIREMVKASIANSAYNGILEEPSEQVMEYYASMNIRRPPHIKGWKQVGEAIKKGRITTFDARELLPKELFNVTMSTMKQWEGDFSGKIAVFGDGRLPTSFDTFVNSRKVLSSEPGFSKSMITLADEDMFVAFGQRTHIPDHQKFTAYRTTAPGKLDRDVNTATGYVHTRRLPAFHKKLPDIEELMGIKEDVLRGQSMLWLGSTPGGFHFDEEANVYVQLSGVTYAFLVPQNYTDYFTGAVRHPWHSQGLPGWETVQQDPKLKDVPIYLVPLYPGDGVTLHGRTYHRFVAQTHDRVALNWFFIPGWRKMEYTPSDWYSIEASRSLTRLAVRSLWARTIARVYDATGLGIVYMGTKLEYL